MSAKQLRPYQREAIEAFNDSDAQSQLLIMPTGTGKTFTFSMIAREWSEVGKVLVLAHREELVDQAVAHLQGVGLNVGVEMAERKAALMFCEAVVASVQTLKEKRRASFNPDDFSLVIVDEAHHATAKSYVEILEHFDGVKRLGVTATPERADKVDLGDIFERVCYQYDLLRAIQEEYLVPPIGKKCPESFDLSGLKRVNGDIAQGQLDDMMTANVEPIAHAIARETEGKKTMIFMPGVASAHALAQVLERLGIGAKSLDGSTDKAERKSTLDHYSRGTFTHLVNCMLFTEGFDEPSIESIVICRPTESRALYMQMVGRGMRLHPGKEFFDLVEFTYNSDKFSLVKPFELFASSAINSEVREIAEFNASKGDGPVDYFGLLERSREYVESNIQRCMVKTGAKFKSFDPLRLMSIEGMDIDGQLPNREWVHDKISAKQFGFLKAAFFHVDQIRDMKKGQASVLIGFIKKDLEETGEALFGWADRWAETKLAELSAKR